jgi:hypothetical protein
VQERRLDAVLEEGICLLEEFFCLSGQAGYYIDPEEYIRLEVALRSPGNRI